MITHSQRARAKRCFRIVVLVSSHGSMIPIKFNRKVIFYMKKQCSNTFGLVKYTAQQKFSTDFIIAPSFVRIRNNLFQAINTYG